MSPRGRIILLIVIVATLAITGFVLTDRGVIDVARFVEEIRKAATSPWAPVLYIAAYVLLAIFMIPPILLSIAGTLIWGWWLGGLWELAGAFTGAILPYMLANSLGGDWIRQKVRNRYPEVERTLEKNGTFALLLVRIVPVIPYTLLNYLAGLMKIRPVTYLWVTLVGMIPSIFIFTWFVDSIAHGLMTEGEATLRVFLACTLIALMIIAGRVVVLRLKQGYD